MHPTDQTPAVSPWAALYQTLTEPAATLRSLADRPRFPILPAYLVAMILGVAGMLILLPMTLDLQAELMAQNPMPGPGFELVKWMTIITSVLTILAAPWLTGLIVAGIAAFVGQFAGGGVPFRAYFGMAGYARIPVLIGGLIQSALAIPADSFEALQKVSLSPAVFFPEPNIYISTLLATLNPFIIWYYVLLAIGFGVLHQVKPIRGIWLVAVLYVLSTGITLATAALGSAFAPGM